MTADLTTSKDTGGSDLKKTTAMDMTKGAILPLMIKFALPLVLGNMFQMLYNMVDIIVVGNFVGKEALAAVGSTTMIINILVFFFNGFSIGAGVVISRFFGAGNLRRLHDSIETTMAATFVLCVAFTIVGVLNVPLMLRLMATPDDVFEAAGTYLRIYFAGIAGLLIYNMGSGVLRAVGDTKRPLMFLMLTSIMNIFLDLLFVIAFHAGIAGVGYATIIAQAISAVMILALLTATGDIYKFVWKDLKIDSDILRDILSVGLPAGVSSMLTSISNVFVQSYVNAFGSACMAGWGVFLKLEQFVFLPMHSMAAACTTFVSQNMGAGNEKRAHSGTLHAIAMMVTFTVCVSALLFVAADRAVWIFSKDASVIYYGTFFVHHAIFFLFFNCINHVLAGAIRGRGNGKGPMVIMLCCFVALRQLYLFIGSRLTGSVLIVAFAFPVGWVSCGITEITYYYLKYVRKKQ